LRVTEPDFFFALEFTSLGASATIVEELTSNVLGHVGCSRDDVPELAGALEHALAADAGGARRCDLQFSVQGRTLKILVSSRGGQVWQISHSISRT
jgi:hypothetical protein